MRHFLWVISYDTFGFGDLCASEPLLSYVQVMSWHLFGKYFSLKICWSLPMDRANNINNFDGGNGKGCFSTRVGYKKHCRTQIKKSLILTRRNSAMKQRLSIAYCIVFQWNTIGCLDKKRWNTEQEECPQPQPSAHPQTHTHTHTNGGECPPQMHVSPPPLKMCYQTNGQYTGGEGPWLQQMDVAPPPHPPPHPTPMLVSAPPLKMCYQILMSNTDSIGVNRRWSIHILW